MRQSVLLSTLGTRCAAKPRGRAREDLVVGTRASVYHIGAQAKDQADRNHTRSDRREDLCTEAICDASHGQVRAGDRRSGREVCVAAVTDVTYDCPTSRLRKRVRYSRSRQPWCILQTKEQTRASASASNPNRCTRRDYVEAERDFVPASLGHVARMNVTNGAPRPGRTT